ncbi:hypothetical protein U472_03540 [Orenia metallireducens]|uniref:Flagellar hook-associated protein 2 n=1 Tax=Orenia metallireducens TaxID=1413210 RepID=A0A1C0AB78_9FIRM|nr:flagellar filament capping protein FliD [Orenia metallireducens]OCL27635.1 hypothetical protein U472_03540 [Orenia metallireducens]
MGISLGGFSGLDTDSIISQLMYIEEQPLRSLQQKQVDIGKQITAWQKINTTLDTFKRKAEDLESVFSEMSVSTSDDDKKYLSATAESNAISGSYEVEVTSLAKKHTLTSGSAVADSPFSTSGSITIGINGSSLNIDVTSSTTLQDVAEAINKATVDHDGDDATNEIHLAEATVVEGRLILKSSDEAIVNNDVTKDNKLTLSDGGSGLLAALKLDSSSADPLVQPIEEAPAAAVFTVNGIDITGRYTNKGLDDVIEGLTLNLEKEHLVGESTTITIGTDKDAMKSKIKEFVNQYNSIIDMLETYGHPRQENIENGEQGAAVLSGDANLSTIQSSLYNAVMYPVNGVISEEFVGSKDTRPLSQGGNLKITTTNYDGTTSSQTIDLSDTSLTLDGIVNKIKSATGIDARIIEGIEGRLVIESTDSSISEISLSGSDSSVLKDLALPQGLQKNTVSLIGIEMDEKGKLSINESKLEKALENNLSDVDQLFTKIKYNIKAEVDKATGYFKAANGKEYQGYVKGSIEGLQNQRKYVDDDIENLERRLVLREERLKAKFTQMEQLISQMQNQGNWLSGITGSMGSY